MHALLNQFYEKMDILIQLGVRNNFNFPKLHAMLHYLPMIVLHRTANRYNTKSTKRLHIDIAKDGYTAHGKVNFTAQMIKWLERSEWIAKHSAYIDWVVQNKFLE